jgi:hypothetical protein
MNPFAPFWLAPFAAATLFASRLSTRHYLAAAFFAGARRLVVAKPCLCSTGGTVNDMADEAAAVKILLFCAAGAALLYRCPTHINRRQPAPHEIQRQPEYSCG